LDSSSEKAPAAPESSDFQLDLDEDLDMERTRERRELELDRAEFAFERRREGW